MPQPEDFGVSREIQEKLETYLALLVKWQASINLISPNTLADAWNRHFTDSMQIGPLVPPDTKTLYDLGSGAGFPGLVLAITKPEITVSLIESDAKKCAFLQTVSRETGIKVTVVNGRIEAAVETLPPPDVITARALSSLESLFKYCRPWVKNHPSLRMIFPKGEHAAYEMGEAKAAGWRFDVEETVSQTERSARILVFSNLAKTAV